MRRSSIPVAASCIAAFASPLAAQQPQQQVRPPIATYWVSAETVGGLAAMGGGGGGGLSGAFDMMRRMASGGGAPIRNLTLQLGSTQAPSGEPRAEHMIPPALNMGASLPLVTPQAQPRVVERERRELPERMEQPRGRMKIYWGCGDEVRAGQPVVIDFARLSQGQVPAGAFASRSINAPNPPAPSRARTYGEWPNDDKRVQVPEGASLRGDHVVRGSYSPEIRFAVGERHDFMPGVNLSNRSSAAGGRTVQWQPIAQATGFFATAFGGNAQEEVIMWSSSETQEMGGALMDYLPNGEVARLVRERVVMSPQTTECTVPAQVVREMGGAPMLSFIAYGEELNLVHPPRPQDPRQPWLQEYAVKVRNKSTSFTMLADGMPGMGAQDARRREAPPASPSADAPADAGGQGAQTGSASSDSGSTNPVQQGVQQGIQILRGLFGR